MVDEIAKLLEQAESPKDRAVLLVLYRIHQSMVNLDKEVTQHREEFAQHRDDFDKHVKDEQTLLNRGLGAWMALTMVLSTCLAFSGWYVGKHILTVNEDQQRIIDINSNRLTALEQLIKSLQQQQGNGGVTR